ncbi:MAG: hypothetical protein FWC42_09075 [Proteobacteria bacterium]|nr:hypothetical protein [Pseudomonadota bacterium]MCL2310403.1 hypothetical protein [Pseudomonadota bacterium]
MFANSWNPSSTEVRAWAYTAGAEAPCQDWDLACLWARHERDYIEFASDKNCPHRLFFLHVLYLIVGDAVRNGFRNIPEAVIRGFVELAATSTEPSVRLWRERSLRLLKRPSEFDYEAWCAGGFANEST